MLALALGVLLGHHRPLDLPPAAPREFRGVWVATVDHIDWPPRDVFDPVKQRERLVEILDQAKRVHLNAVIFQVRPMADALYASKYEPWSEFLTGAQGEAPTPYWDPLEFAVKEAHKRGLELHAWFNPYRAWMGAAKGRPAANFVGNAHPKWVKSYGNLQWLDPGEKGVAEWSENVILDVVRRYDVDGVHLDDYFYPYPQRNSQRHEIPFPDDASWDAYRADGGSLDRPSWRRQNVDRLISDLYRKIKEVKSWVKFGISPFGIYRPGYPPEIKAGLDQYNALYADPVKWLQNGWCDYLSPQLYWQIRKPAQSYPVLAKWWSEQNTLHRHLWFGNNLSQVSAAWPPEEIVDQIKLTRETGCDGDVLFSMTPLMKDSKGIDQMLTRGPYEEPALVPECRWLKARAPKAPKISVGRQADGSVVSIQKQSQDSFEWGVYVRLRSGWAFEGAIPSEDKSLLLASKLYAGADEVAISALDRCGNESERTIAAL